MNKEFCDRCGIELIAAEQAKRSMWQLQYMPLRWVINAMPVDKDTRRKADLCAECWLTVVNDFTTALNKRIDVLKAHAIAKSEEKTA